MDRQVNDYTYQASVVQVLDGDTVRCTLDLGLRIYSTQPVRLAGIDAPEKHTDAGKAARAFLASLLQPGEAVVVHTRKPDKYGRVLGTILASHDGHQLDVAQAMVQAGHAVPYDGGAR